MNREIKFRLRDKNNNIAGYEKWYCGSYLKEEKRYVANPCWLYSIDNKHWTPKYIEHRYKDQFTGLSNKTGKEFYEGDIVKIRGHFVRIQKDGYSLHKIQWGYEDWCAGFFLIGITSLTEEGNPSVNHFNQKWANDCEIVGSILENKELLQ